MLIAFFSTSSASWALRSVITGATDRDISRLPEILQPLRQSAVTYTKILGTATNAKLLVIEIVLDSIQLKLFVMLLCHNEILLQYDTSIVSLIVYLEFSHFDLYYLYSSTTVNHNSRKFHAKNTDPERSYLNVEYCNENVKDVYHELFDEALARYNEKQTRSDRRIEDYYEKIRSGKQEKPFHEIILQIGDKDNMGAKTENGQLAAKVLDKYMQDF